MQFILCTQHSWKFTPEIKKKNPYQPPKPTQYRTWFLKETTSIFPLLCPALLALFEKSAFFFSRYLKCKLNSFENLVPRISQMYNFWHSRMLCRKRTAWNSEKSMHALAFHTQPHQCNKPPTQFTTQPFFSRLVSPKLNILGECLTDLQERKKKKEFLVSIH